MLQHLELCLVIVREIQLDVKENRSEYVKTHRTNDKAKRCGHVKKSIAAKISAKDKASAMNISKCEKLQKTSAEHEANAMNTSTCVELQNRQMTIKLTP